MCVDDDADDIELLREALLSVEPSCELLIAKDGNEAIHLLTSLKEQKQLPCLIVLDVNMPRMDGRETAVWLSKDRQLSQIPLVVLSTSSSLVDKLFFERTSVDYLVKPFRIEELMAMARKLIGYCKTDE